jgi:serine/threonine-protein kinase ULK/ATG1
MLQLASGLHAMRRSQLIHRDLKPQNLLLTADDLNADLKIADFGFARYVRDSEGMADTVCGSPLYMAPEVLNYQKYDAKADLWSTGAILFEMLVGQVPFTGQNQVQLLRNIQTTEFKIPGHIAKDLSPECIDLLRGLLRRDADNRISFDEFFNHPFFKLDVGVQIPHNAKETKVKSECHAARSGCSDDSETMTFDMDVEGASSPTHQMISVVNQAQTRPMVAIPKHRLNSDADEVNLGADYVLVSSPGAITRNRSMAIRSPSLGSSPLSRMSPSPSDGGSSPLSGPARMLRGASPTMNSPMMLNRGQQTHSQVLVAHLGVRVGVLEKAAAVLRDTSIEQWNFGNKLEALSLGLISLAALRSAYRLVGEILSSEQGHGAH